MGPIYISQTEIVIKSLKFQTYKYTYINMWPLTKNVKATHGNYSKTKWKTLQKEKKPRKLP